MINFEARATIGRPAAEVWAYAAAFDQHPLWMAVSNPRLISGRPTEVGGRGREILHLGPFRFDTEFEVIAAEPGRLIGWRALSGLPFEFVLRLELEPLDGGSTRARYRGAVRLEGAWRLLYPLIAAEAKAAPARELGLLKAAIESGRAVVAAQA